MYFLVKLLKKFFTIFNSAAQPWQIFIGVLLGTLLGFLPVFPLSHGPALLGCVILLLALLINCHLTAVMLFFAIGKLLSFALTGPAVMIGDSLDGLARASAEIPFLHGSLWSHTGWLGLTILGFCLAPLFAIAMWRLTVLFRVTLRAPAGAQTGGHRRQAGWESDFGAVGVLVFRFVSREQSAPG